MRTIKEVSSRTIPHLEGVIDRRKCTARLVSTLVNNADDREQVDEVKDKLNGELYEAVAEIIGRHIVPSWTEAIRTSKLWAELWIQLKKQIMGDCQVRQEQRNVKKIVHHDFRTLLMHHALGVDPQSIVVGRKAAVLEDGSLAIVPESTIPEDLTYMIMIGDKLQSLTVRSCSSPHGISTSLGIFGSDTRVHDGVVQMSNLLGNVGFGRPREDNRHWNGYHGEWLVMR
jgi:hypothetical protein